jgi:hypothetical protein
MRVIRTFPGNTAVGALPNRPGFCIAINPDPSMGLMAAQIGCYE